MDREKVIKGLECCYASFPKLKGCPVCPYEKNCYHNRACDDLLLDTLALLKEQEAKAGKWIEKTDYMGDTYYDCSVCGESWTTIDGTPWQNGMNYCPHCGAKMET